MKRLKQAKGITLIALVLTIIVLLILAGISIAMLTGENGIISQANEAKEKYKTAEIEEMIETIYRAEIKLDNKETLKDKLIRDKYVEKEELEEKGIIDLTDSITIISNRKGLNVLSENVNNGIDYNNKKIYITNDIDMETQFDSKTGELISGSQFIPIGDCNVKIEEENQEGAEIKEFNGTFDGFNYSIKKLYIKENTEGEYCTGLFGYTGENSTIKNITIESSYIHGYYETGALVGRNKGTIENSTNKSMVIGDYYLTGGIAGRNVNKIKNCNNSENIKGGERQTGGIVGNCDFSDKVIVENCKNTGRIQASGNAIGGIIGGMFESKEGNKVTVVNCQNEGEIGDKTNQEVGGIAGTCIGTETINCINKGIVKSHSKVGGIIGYLRKGKVQSSKNHGNITIYYRAGGGIAGLNARRNYK